MTPAFINVTGLEPDAVRVLEFIRDRLLVGQSQYGRLDIARDTRDWPREASEEAADLAVYLSVAILMRQLREVTGPAVRRVAAEGI